MPRYTAPGCLAPTLRRWQVPIKDRPEFRPDDMRLAVAKDAFSLHVVGQEDAPLLAGETSGPLNPKGSSWRVANYRTKGTQRLLDIEITLQRAPEGGWSGDLIKTWLV